MKCATKNCTNIIAPHDLICESCVRIWINKNVKGKFK